MNTDEAYIETWTGTRFYFMKPKACEVHIGDIAYSLAHTVRWGGHCTPCITVAQHCVMVSDMVATVTDDAEEQLRALLHDAAEAYIPDIPSPIKPFLSDFKAIEEKLEQAVFERFGIPGKLGHLIHTMDAESARWEYRDLMPGHSMPLPVQHRDRLLVLEPEEAERQFLVLFDHLIFKLFGPPWGKGRINNGRSLGLDRGDFQDSGERVSAPRPDTGDAPRGQIHQVQNPGIGTGPALVVAGYDGGCHVPGGQAGFVFRPAGHPHEGSQDGSS